MIIEGLVLESQPKWLHHISILTEYICLFVCLFVCVET